MNLFLENFNKYFDENYILDEVIAAKTFGNWLSDIEGFNKEFGTPEEFITNNVEEVDGSHDFDINTVLGWNIAGSKHLLKFKNRSNTIRLGSLYGFNNSIEKLNKCLNTNYSSFEQWFNNCCNSIQGKEYLNNHPNITNIEDFITYYQIELQFKSRQNTNSAEFRPIATWETDINKIKDAKLTNSYKFILHNSGYENKFNLNNLIKPSKKDGSLPNLDYFDKELHGISSENITVQGWIEKFKEDPKLKTVLNKLEKENPNFDQYLHTVVTTNCTHIIWNGISRSIRRVFNIEHDNDCQLLSPTEILSRNKFGKEVSQENDRTVLDWLDEHKVVHGKIYSGASSPNTPVKHLIKVECCICHTPLTRTIPSLIKTISETNLSGVYCDTCLRAQVSQRYDKDNFKPEIDEVNKITDIASKLTKISKTEYFENKLHYIIKDAKGKSIKESKLFRQILPSTFDKDYIIELYKVNKSLDNISPFGDEKTKDKHVISEIAFAYWYQYPDKLWNISTSSELYLKVKCIADKSHPEYISKISAIYDKVYHGCPVCLESSTGRNSSKSQWLAEIALTAYFGDSAVRNDFKIKPFNTIDILVDFNDNKYAIEYDGEPYHNKESLAYVHKTDYRKTDLYNQTGKYKFIRMREAGCYEWQQEGVITDEGNKLNTKIKEITVNRTLYNCSKTEFIRSLTELITMIDVKADIEQVQNLLNNIYRKKSTIVDNYMNKHKENEDIT